MKINALSSLANAKFMQRSVNWATKVTKTVVNPQGEKKLITNYDKVQKYYPLAFSVWVGIMQSFLTYKSKDMPKERKVPLAINIGIGDVLGLTGSLLVNNSVNNFTQRVQNRLEKLPIEEKEKLHLKNGVKTAIPFFISAFMFKYAAQVIATPLANTVNKYLEKKGIIKYSKKDPPIKIEETALSSLPKVPKN